MIKKCDKERCSQCFVSHFTHPNTKVCKLKRKQRNVKQLRLRGGAKNKEVMKVSLEQSLLNLEESITPMISCAISNAKSHGINVHRGVANLANGNCAFETIIDGISTQTCFGETYDGTPDH